ncbi:sodium bile acid symporter [Xylariaceae sp. FL0255]|nr:sodium bile acid symporter [Xylariaceae sp. FL0255]
MEIGDSPDEVHSKAYRVARTIVVFLLNNWLLFGFGLATLLAYLFPNVAARGGIIRSEYSVLYGVIGLIFLINGAQLGSDKLKKHVSNWRLHFVVQVINLTLIPIIQLILVRIIIAAGGITSGNIEPSILVGMVVVSCIPTTVASNVVMTRNAGGDEAAAIIEVIIGNVLGAFISPFLIYAFLPTDPVFNSLQPAGPDTLGPMYIEVLKQLGLSVLLPLAVGQALRWSFPKQVVWTLDTFYLGKFTSILLIIVVWSTFSGAFETGALTTLPKSSVIFNVFINLAEYFLFTALCYYIAYPPLFFARVVNCYIADSRIGSKLPQQVRQVITVKRMSEDLVVAACFCGAAKTTSLGIPLVAAMWSKLDNFTIASIQVPVLLYTVEQIFVAQFLTIFFKAWLDRRTKVLSDEEAVSPTEPVSVEGSVRDGVSPVVHDTAQRDGEIL